MTNIFNKRVFDDKEKLQEMLVLRFVHYWSLLRLGTKYGVSREAIRLQCLKHESEYVHAKHDRSSGPIEGRKLTTMASILAERGEMPPEAEERPIFEPIVAPRKPRYIMDTSELRDEFGERINRGRSYKDYLREQYPKLKLSNIEGRRK